MREIISTFKNQLIVYEKSIFLCFSVLIFLYSALRCFFVPIFHDEAATFFHFIQVDSYIPFYAEWDAGNHLLNTALAHFLVNIFDEHMFWMRLPNLLSLPVYFYFIYKITRQIRNNLVRYITSVALLSAAFLIEFYSQARGYGMSMAFFSGAIYFCQEYFSSQHCKNQLYLWLFMLLTLLANMSMLNTQLIFCGLIMLFILFNVKHKKVYHLFIWIFGGIGILIISAWYAFIMREKGLLYTGLPDGFVEVTSMSFSKYQFGIKSLFLSWTLTLVGLFASLFLIFDFLKKKYLKSVGILIALLLLLNSIGAILLNWFFDVNFPEERTGVYFLLLWILVVGFAIDTLSKRNISFRYLALGLLFFPVHFFANMNLNSSLLWYDLHFEKDILEAAHQFQKQKNKPIRISAFFMFELTWAYQNILYKYPLQLTEVANFPDSTAELIFIRTADFQHNIKNCDTIYYNQKSSYLLISPKKSFQKIDTLMRKVIENNFIDDREYFNITHWLRDSLSIFKEESGILEFSISANSFDKAVNGQIIIKIEDVNNQLLKYDYLKLQWLKKIWNNDSLIIRRGYHLPINAYKVNIFYWNLGQKRLRFEVSDITQIKFSIP